MFVLPESQEFRGIRRHHDRQVFQLGPRVVYVVCRVHIPLHTVKFRGMLLITGVFLAQQGPCLVDFVLKPLSAAFLQLFPLCGHRLLVYAVISAPVKLRDPHNIGALLRHTRSSGLSNFLGELGFGFASLDKFTLFSSFVRPQGLVGFGLWGVGLDHCLWSTFCYNNTRVERKHMLTLGFALVYFPRFIAATNRTSDRAK